MYEFHPYFTNDGSVGLYNSENDDVYHSCFGALSEAWEKFVVPSHLESLLKSDENIKILDICYGIGYNSKATIQYILNDYYKYINSSNKLYLTIIDKLTATKCFFTAVYEVACEKKICEKLKNLFIIKFFAKISKKLFSKNSEKFLKISNTLKLFSKKISLLQEHIAQIYTDKIKSAKIDNFLKNIYKKILLHNDKTTGCIDEIYADNIPREIYIDALDIDSTLIKISPLITNSLNSFNAKKNSLHCYYENDKIKQIEKIKNKKTFIPNKQYIISDDVSKLIIKSLIDSDFSITDDEDIKKIILNKNNSPYFDKNLINFAKFYQIYRYKTNQDVNNSTFLHNIYYRYVSKRYKTRSFSHIFDSIHLKFHHNDARLFVLNSNQKYNLIFLDAFTPSKCPNLWTVDFFEKLYQLLENNGMILTYSNSSAVRNALLLNDFKLGKIYDKSLNKFVGTIATKDESLIEYPLDEKDFALINSKAGIVYKDSNLTSDSKSIIMNRDIEFENSTLISSSKALKKLKDNV